MCKSITDLSKDGGELQVNSIKNFGRELKKNKVLFLMTLPIIVYFFIFSYMVMPGVYIAFVNYNYSQGMFGSQFVGMDNFKFLAMNGDLWRITRNTILYNVVFILLGNIIQIFIAIMISEVSGKWFKKVSQSVMLLPTFMSAVIIGVFAYNLFSFNQGMVNSIFTSLGIAKHDFYSDTGIWKYIIVMFNIWKSTGYGMIIYLATITGISTEIYEAAVIDGANIVQKIKYITIPLVKPTFVMLLLFSLGGIMRGQFDLFYNLVGNNSLLFPQTDIIDTYVFRSLTGNFNFSLSSAVGFYQSLFGLILVFTVNYIVNRIDSDYALF